MLYEDGDGVLPGGGSSAEGATLEVTVADTATWYWRSRCLVRLEDLRSVDLIDGLSGRHNARTLGE